jgi:phospholipase C
VTVVGRATTADVKGNGAALFGGRSFARVRGGRRAMLALALMLVLAAIAWLRVSSAAASSPIEHVVVILQENHSFDNVLGPLCIQDRRRKCNAASSGKNEKGETIPLSKAADKVVAVDHSQQAQLAAMDNGKMDGWELVNGCTEKQCYTAYEPSQIPSLAALARQGAISDAFFSRDIVPSWGAHLDFFAQRLDGFVGNNPAHATEAPAAGPGWGCDSNLNAQWYDPTTGKLISEPSCIPNKNGEGPWRTSPVPYVPTVADRLEEAGRTWGIYGAVVSGGKAQGGYVWSTCPTFAECLLGPQKEDMHEAPQFMSDAKAGKLPNFSIVTPSSDAEGATSQHNGTSMLVGDNFIGQQVSAVENGPDGATTTIFIYYDDCGCFYDHVTPPQGLGIRSPLVIVSPYAKRGYTDHNVATNSSILAYMEAVLHVNPVDGEDASSYNFRKSFRKWHAQVKFVFHAAQVAPSSRNLNPLPEST